MLGFHVSYGTPEAHKELIRCFREIGLSPMLARLPRCVVQWAPYSKLAWNQHLQGCKIVSSYFCHHGIVNKVELFDFLRNFSGNYVIDKILIETITISENGCQKEDDLPDSVVDCNWVLKANSANNATQVYFLKCPRSKMDLLRSISLISENEKPTSWILQRHVDLPLLYQGRKFHIRCNVLAVGRLVVFVHHDMVLHVATERFEVNDLSNRFRHITNHVQQREHPEYTPENNIITLDILEEYLYKETGKPVGVSTIIRENIHSAVREVFCAFHEKATGRKSFMATKDAFELYGFDFLVLDNAEFDVKLLEVNSGPALGGHSSMAHRVCSALISDSVHLVTSFWYDAKMKTPKDLVIDNNGVVKTEIAKYDRYHQVYKSCDAECHIISGDFVSYIRKLSENP